MLCKPWEHTLTRRRVLGGMAGAAALGGFADLCRPAPAEELRSKEAQVLLLWLDGGLSQLESWDPKPHTRFGGPFRAIPTSLPGVAISELMPRTATIMHKLAVVRGMCTQDNAHSSGVPRVLRGDPKNRGVTYPYFGSAVSKLLGPTASGFPPYLWIKAGNGGFFPRDAGFLGGQHGSLALGDGKPPKNMTRPAGLSPDEDAARNELRARFNRRYAERRPKEWSEANSHVYGVADTLMKNEALFDETRLPDEERRRYGEHDFGKHVLLARRLLEAGARFIMVTSYGWDTHGDNFDAHASRVPKVDQTLHALLTDMESRGQLDHVLVVMMAEFGRTPRVNGSLGRDHWPEAWSLAMAGRGVRPGVVLGETNAQGTAVAKDPYDIGHMFHTWFRALGLDSKKAEYHNGTQPLPIAHDDCHPVKELLLQG